MIVDEYPLSHLQEGMLYHFLSGENPGVDIEQIVIDYSEPLEMPQLRQAWCLTTERHGALRASFQWDSAAQPVQQVHDRVALPFDLPTGAVTPEEFDAWLAADRLRGFDLSVAPLMRLTVFHLGHERYRLVWTVHHILVDRRALLLVLNEVETNYRRLCGGESPVAEPGPNFRGCLESLPRPDAAAAREFWAHRLREMNGPTPLLEDPQAQAARSPGYLEEELRLSEMTSASLRDLAGSRGVTLNTIAMAVWGLLLSRYSGEQDVVFGVAKTLRHSTVSHADDAVGLLLNALPMRASFPADAFFDDVLGRLRSQWLSLRAFENTPDRVIREASGFAPGTSLVESLLVFERQSPHRALTAMNRCWERRPVRFLGQTVYPLRLGIWADPQIALNLSFDGRRFTRPAAQRILGHARQIFESIAAEPHQKIAAINLLTPAERHQILVEWNNTDAPFPDKCVHQLFEEQAQRTPGAVAVASDRESLTYAELNRRANQLAHYLRQLGVGPEVAVAICIERSPAMIVALLAVLKAGGAYVPLDPDYPLDRLRFMLQDSAPAALLTQAHLRPLFADIAFSIPVIDAGEATPPWLDLPDSNPDAASIGLNPSNLAYIIYTSGSTGKPKGTLEQHNGLTNLIHWFIREVPLSDRVVVLVAASISFDLTYKNIYGPLLSGGQIFLTPNRFDRNVILSLIPRVKNGLLNVTPTALNTLIEEDHGHVLSQLRTIVMGGEPVQLHSLALLKEPRPQLINSYGPTEITGSAAFHRIRPDLDYGGNHTVPIGRQLPNVRIYILDGQRQPVPIGVTGEIYIGGIGVARGYLNRPELTREHFLPDPFAGKPGARMYKSGDLGRWLPDGSIDFRGRNDFQVKIRGMRIELGEIEARLLEHPAVREACVLAREDKPGDKRLVAYYLPAAEMDDAAQPEQLRSHLSAVLPAHMVPAAYVQLACWPRTPSGKLDRKALPPPGGEAFQIDRRYEPARGLVESELAGIWSEVLQAPRIGRRDNFFALGGHSLSAMRVVGRLRTAFEVDLPVAALFQNPTLESFAALIEAKAASADEGLELLRLLGEIEAMPESSVEGSV